MSALRAAVADKVGKERFALWFGAAARFELAGDRLSIVVPNPFFQQWLRSSFCGQIERACEETLGRRPSLEFRVDPALRLPGPDAARSADGDGKPGPSSGTDPACHQTGSHLEPMRRDGNGSPTPRPSCDLDAFVTGVSNRLAYAAAESVVRKPGELSPLLVHGPTAVGKTCLLEAISASLRKHHPRLTAIYLSAEQFTTGFLQALRGSGLPSFRRKYRGVGVLLLDDLQFFSGKRCTQIELLYTVDTLLRERRQLVFAADRPPEDLSDLGPDLMSRLASGFVCRVEPPDFDTRLGIVARMATRFGMIVPEDVRRFIASQFTRHARELSGALCRLHAAGQAIGKPISLELAEEALAELIRSSACVVRLPDIQKAMCDAFGIDPKALQARGKAKAVTHPRMLAMWLARKYTRSALSEISSYFGRRSHSTVISAQKRIDRWLADGKSLELAHRAWKVDEAIQQVERRLQAG